jgi:Protein of unknown function (DUF1553)/Protein of unknown function (DUF1549)
MVVGTLSWLACLVAVAPPSTDGTRPDLWALQPVARPEAAAGLTESTNPIDAFIAEGYAAKGLKPVGSADRQTLLRRVSLDLTGLPPTLAEQEAFVHDSSPDAYEKVVDRLLANEQHGVRYGRHWLDVLRYADVDETMIAAAGLYLWRDWVIHALNDDVPYDQFVRAQLIGSRSAKRVQVSPSGGRRRLEPRPDDMFALGFLARGAVLRDGKDNGELPITAVETVSTAFMGLTVGCAKCHDHMYDPIKQRDFYAMKALFDPLVLRKVILATPAEMFASGKAQGEAEAARAAIEVSIERLIGPYRKQLFDERLALLPSNVRDVINKPEQARTVAEQKIADDYYPVLRIDSDKLQEIMPATDRKTYQDLQGRLNRAGGGRRVSGLPAFWTVEVDPKKAEEKSFILTSGDSERPEKDHEVQPGWPFAPPSIDFRDGRIEAFADWLTAPQNPLFARVAVNRLWQWHFGEGLQKTPSDFGELGGTPANPRLLDWLASELVRRNFSMKAMHKLIVTSLAYRLSTEVEPGRATSDGAIDPENIALAHFRLRRLEAEPIWDSILAAAGDLDLTVGGWSFDVRSPSARGTDFGARSPSDSRTNRRAAYMIRGYSTSRDAMPNFLQAFDVDDGRAPCPVRTRTVAAPQSLFLMNSAAITQATAKFAERLKNESRGDLSAAVDLAYRLTLTRSPSPAERARVLTLLADDPARLKDLAWLLFNLDEFIYVR